MPNRTGKFKKERRNDPKRANCDTSCYGDMIYFVRRIGKASVDNCCFDLRIQRRMGGPEMEKKLREFFDKLLENRMRRAVALVLAIIVTFTTTYTLVLPAITLEKDTAETMSGVSLGGNEQDGDTSTSTESEDSDDSGLDDSNNETVAFDAEAKNEDGETEALVHVEADIDTFPAGTTMEATVVTDQGVIDSIAEAAEGEVVAVRAVDLKFTDEKW